MSGLALVLEGSDELQRPKGLSQPHRPVNTRACGMGHGAWAWVWAWEWAAMGGCNGARDRMLG